MQPKTTCNTCKQDAPHGSPGWVYTEWAPTCPKCAAKRLEVVFDREDFLLDMKLDELGYK